MNDKDEKMLDVHNSIIESLDFGSVYLRIKLQLIQFAKMGIFFNIPGKLLDKENEFDRKVQNTIKECLIKENYKTENLVGELEENNIQFFPDGLYDKNSPEETTELYNLILDKLKSGNKICLGSWYEDYNFSEEQIDTLVENGCVFFETNTTSIINPMRNVAQPNDTSSTKQRFEILLDDLQNDINYMGNNSDIYVKIFEMFELAGKLENEEYKDALFILDQLDDLFVGNKELGNRVEIAESRNSLYKQILDGISDFKNTEKDVFSGEHFEKQRERLFFIIKLLKNCGSLEMLIQNENFVIQRMNELLDADAQIELITEEGLIERINSYDLNDSKDVMKFLAHNRLLSNKLAHINEMYMYTEFYLQLKSSAEIFGENGTKNHVLGNKLRDLYKLFDYDPSKTLTEDEEEQLKNNAKNNVLELNEEYKSSQRYINEGKNDVIKRLFINDLFKNLDKLKKSNGDKLNVIKKLRNKLEDLSEEDIRKLKSTKTSGGELDRILNQILDSVDEETKVRYISSLEDSFNRKTTKSKEEHIEKIVDTIFNGKKELYYGLEILKEIAFRNGKTIPFDMDLTKISFEKFEEFEECLKLGEIDEKNEMQKMIDSFNLPPQISEAIKRMKGRKLNHKNPLYNQLKELKDSVTGKRLLREQDLYLIECYVDNNKRENFLEYLYEMSKTVSQNKNKLLNYCNLNSLGMSKSKEDYCFRKKSEISKILSMYEKAVERDFEIGEIETRLTCYDFIKYVLYKDIISSDGIEENQESSNEIGEYFENLVYYQEGVKINLAEELRRFERSLKEDEVLMEFSTKNGKRDNGMFVMFVLGNSKDAESWIFKTKHHATLSLASFASEFPKEISIEGVFPEENKDGLISFHFQNVPQTNSAHNKWREYSELKEVINVEDMYRPPDIQGDISDCFKIECNGNRMPLSSYIVQDTLNQKQIDSCKKICKLIGMIDGKLTLTPEEQEGEKERIKKLKDLKSEDPISYTSTTIRFLLGAGEEYYKAFYGKGEKDFSAFMKDVKTNPNNCVENARRNEQFNAAISYESANAGINKIKDLIEVKQEHRQQ